MLAINICGATKPCSYLSSNKEDIFLYAGQLADLTKATTILLPHKASNTTTPPRPSWNVLLKKMHPLSSILLQLLNFTNSEILVDMKIYSREIQNKKIYIFIWVFHPFKITCMPSWLCVHPQVLPSNVHSMNSSTLYITVIFIPLGV